MPTGDAEPQFTIRDRRFSQKTDEQSSRQAASPSTDQNTLHLPEVDFSSFILSLSSSAMLHLGDFPDPLTQKQAKNLPLAKQTIDILAILQEKTRGNLTGQEEKLLADLLYELRMRYVKEAN